MTFSSLLRVCALSSFSLFLQHVSAYVGSATVSSTILIIARDTTSATNGAALGLQGYGIPYEILTVPQAGIANLPLLNSTVTNGNYGGIITISEVGYNYNDLYYSALTDAQWSQLYAYQTNFGVRMVRLDVYPTADFGVSPNGGNLNDEPVSFTNMSGFPSANLKANVPVSIASIYHSPATIVNASIAWEVAKFSVGGSAAVINQIGARQQMVWFLPFALDWAPSSNILQHAWITWITRGLYVGFRRIYLSTQVDDMFLETELYRPQGQIFRVKPEDLSVHVQWQAGLNARMPAGSDYFVEIGHNGNGDIEASVETTKGQTVCSPSNAIEYAEQKDGSPEYQKPPGTGVNIWPTTPTQYTWSLECAKLDALENWFAVASQRDAFAHISHTFSHMDLTNATYSDASKEITFNQAWLKQVGLDAAKRWSPNGIIPPAITGLHNADVIKAWMDNGINNVVGDNTRPPLRNTQSTFWPLTTNVANNGYAGLIVMPRWASVIYYNCDLPACTLQEWIDTSAGKGTFDDLLTNTRNTAMTNLFGLHWDPYMFHQANMRVSDVPSTTVNGKSGQYSLLMTWVEVITAEMMRLTTWPFRTLKHDDMTQQFINRQTRDLCRPSMTWTTSADGASVTSVNVYTAGGNKCGTTIPITVPGPISDTTGATKEQVGSDPLTLWVTMSGASRQYKLSSALQL
ncbi:hypothetical protein PtrSN002B_008332 [Pyrenophora tritici-repentis]|uniref:Uncharacterized protein n=2 Tax=Pyrenophora tritici-repentis TaxID=45151 RepID=A0A2W1DVN8_9PLEO|nr:uncharacterized protein PTRG_04739 [Pyrenophora tritici-repentis Pt-1C-BFP]KAA8612497.1 hypothetical protein PtrV1_13066 [Pyrenophora tritici-repentis]EDU47646.1 conserved hypothetical protein [Pyrenophora tritici-repentis Pt-1C-BFP]KAF7446977.1 hypothetical protein A1F99_084240 [Pyrenophora tritici-repentis]KAF7569260.1 hypothetical protein PtrM4_116750 [Pyrenophora tritici-repentis]KAG9382961.1 hypothetical protein A1F94_006882 [Pyrenophora tritici-repentis]